MIGKGTQSPKSNFQTSLRQHY